jgi:hypothetical protein
MHLLEEELTARLPAATRANWVDRIRSASAERVAECKRAHTPTQGRERARAPRF